MFDVFYSNKKHILNHTLTAVSRHLLIKDSLDNKISNVRDFDY